MEVKQIITLEPYGVVIVFAVYPKSKFKIFSGDSNRSIAQIPQSIRQTS